MKKSKKFLVCILSLLVIGGATVGVATATNDSLFVSGVETGVWNHYSETQGTEVTIGNKEYWVNCGTHTVSFTEPAGEKAEMQGGADTSEYVFHDERFIATPKAYAFEKGVNMIGASVYNVTDKSDYTWGMETPTTTSLDYKSYVDKTFKNNLPLVNFNYYEQLTADLDTTIWNEGFKFGFEEDVATSGMAPAIGVKNGGKLSLIRMDENTVRMIIKHPNAAMDITHDFVGKEYVNGTKSVYYYTFAKGDVHFVFSNITPAYNHAHDWEEEVESETVITSVADICKVCGAKKNLSVPELAFTIVKYGACAYNHTDASDFPTSLMVVTDDQLSYKSYDSGKIFSFTMPRIDFREFSKVNITVSSTNWAEGIGFGFTSEQAQAKTYHTTYGGAKTGGHLSFTWDGDALKVEFVLEYVTMQTVLTDTNVIAGNKGFSLYITSLYDRYLDFSNFQLTLKKAPHVHDWEQGVVSTTVITPVADICKGCGAKQNLVLPTLDFTANAYGATAYNHTDASDYPGSLIIIAADKLSYKSYDNGKIFSFTMPRIDFREFSKVNITVSSTNWAEGIGFGFTPEQAQAKTYHTTYGGEKTGGHLSFTWDGDALKVEFVLEYVTMQTVLTDTNVIQGQKGFSLYITSLWDRYLDFSNFQLTLKA